VLIFGHLIKSQQPGIAGVRSAVKLHRLAAPHWRQPEWQWQIAAWAEPYGRSPPSKSKFDTTFALRPVTGGILLV